MYEMRNLGVRLERFFSSIFVQICDEGWTLKVKIGFSHGENDCEVKSGPDSNIVFRM